MCADSLSRNLYFDRCGLPNYTRPSLADAAGEALKPHEREVLQTHTVGLEGRAVTCRPSIGDNSVKCHVSSILIEFSAASHAEALAARWRLPLL